MLCSAFIATSLDGFIARADGRLDWLPAGGGEDYGYRQFMESVDLLLMGRVTFETVLTFPEWPYGDRPVAVLSNQPAPGLPPGVPPVEWVGGTPRKLLDRFAERGFRHVYVDGGKTIQGFLAAGCLNQLTITRVPILIGSGIPLFGQVPRDIVLKLVTSRSFPDGLQQTTYRIAPAG